MYNSLLNTCNSKTEFFIVHWFLFKIQPIKYVQPVFSLKPQLLPWGTLRVSQICIRDYRKQENTIPSINRVSLNFLSHQTSYHCLAIELRGIIRVITYREERIPIVIPSLGGSSVVSKVVKGECYTVGGRRFIIVTWRTS